MIWSTDTLGLAKYPEHIRSWSKDTGAGVMLHTFGPAWECVRKLGNTQCCPRVRVHSIWDDDHKYNHEQDWPIIKKDINRANRVALDYPHMDVQLSPQCEHTWSKDDTVTLLNQCVALAARVTIVNSSLLGHWVQIPGVVNECHGSQHPPASYPYQWSSDGLSIVDCDVEFFKARHKKALTMFAHISQLNGRMTSKPEDNIPIPDRTAWPSLPLLRSLEFLAREKKAVSLPDKWLWKSHSEQSNVPPHPRELKPVLITPVKKEYFTLGGRKSTPPEKYSDGRWKYYWLEWGFLMMPGYLRSSEGRVYGTVDPGFRGSEFRNREKSIYVPE